MAHFSFSLLVAMVTVVAMVKGHGRMIDPPMRSSAWRYGFSTPPNYNDMGLNCGGTSHQWSMNGGKCGACGDPYDTVEKPNQTPGGKYVTGTIVRSYESSSIIDIKIELTAYHMGYFEFRICPLDPGNGKGTEVTMDCLNEYLLEVGKPGQSEHEFVTRYSIEGDNTLGGQGTGIYNLKVKLPEGLVCDSCVLQWIWHGGNSWGCDADGACGKGKGPQENFWNCADVKLTSSGTAPVTPRPTTSQPPSTTNVTTQMSTTTKTTQMTTKTTKMPTTSKKQTTLKPTPTTSRAKTTTMKTTTTKFPTTTKRPTTNTMKPTTMKPKTTTLSTLTTTTSLDDDIDSSSCVGASSTSNSKIDDLCKKLCQVPADCLPELCVCYDFCRSKNPASLSDQDCKDLCKLFPDNCESDDCSCFPSGTIPITTTMMTTTTTTTPKPPSTGCDCVGVPPFDGPNMRTWCCDNCKQGYCPKSHCKCTIY